MRRTCRPHCWRCRPRTRHPWQRRPRRRWRCRVCPPAFRCHRIRRATDVRSRRKRARSRRAAHQPARTTKPDPTRPAYGHPSKQPLLTHPDKKASPSPGSTKPPWKRGPRRREQEAPRLRRKRDQASRVARLERRSGLELVESRPGQRERERERRVSDADASYYARVRSTRTLKHVIPKRNHAKNNSLSNNDPVPLPRALPKPVKRQTTRPNPKPDLMFDPHPQGLQGHGLLYSKWCLLSSPFGNKSGACRPGCHQAMYPLSSSKDPLRQVSTPGIGSRGSGPWRASRLRRSLRSGSGRCASRLNPTTLARLAIRTDSPRNSTVSARLATVSKSSGGSPPRMRSTIP